ncbi:hypothetical protein FRACYDRAFT_193063 [Fragilariopsis cylindrus CCMP1102]|uniref:Uncharacterized protein n=1 Tax=Fragilariopsis cylindrus CCMP1102 TaxID=635003 RepID=A0A1E7F0I5_9STRA|nr:hypothetical protein FRACYDRAFT_193063 [Fragilariopsis cylindrus CCMP1102]|eukprot:OEU11313.1 hypothetical protein FRACYDRAFT_193063 [Fragilariopsis cylindrus CCMP1102]
MCIKVGCNNCNKPTWKGCGLHIQTALNGVELNHRCPNWKKVSNVRRAIQ